LCSYKIVLIKKSVNKTVDSAEKESGWVELIPVAVGQMEILIDSLFPCARPVLTSLYVKGRVQCFSIQVVLNKCLKKRYIFVLSFSRKHINRLTLTHSNSE